MPNLVKRSDKGRVLGENPVCHLFVGLYPFCLYVFFVFFVLILGELSGGGSILQRSGEGLEWRCYRLPGSEPCPKNDNHDRRSWFYDVTTASCRINPISSCDVTDRVGNDFSTLDECIRTCLTGERSFDSSRPLDALRPHHVSKSTTPSFCHNFTKY